MSEKTKHKILLIDDDESVLYSWVRVLSKENLEIVTAPDVQEALRKLEEGGVAIVFTDLRVGSGSGMEIARNVKEKYAGTCVNVVTGLATVEGAVECMRLGICDYIAKPVSNTDLVTKVRRCLVHCKERQEVGKLREEVQTFKELDRMKSEFVSTVSHELRTPLFAMQGAIDLLLEDQLASMNPGSQELAKVVKSNMERLARLIANILSFSRLERGVLTPTMARMDIAAAADRALRDLSPLMNRKNISHENKSKGNPIEVEADADQIQQILVNLIGNAVKFTPSGGRIDVLVEDKDPDILLEVRDSGSGVDPAFHQKIFDRFYQVDGSLTRETNGVGIGLALVKAIAEMHGGKVWVESEKGKGSRFFVSLPKKQSANAGEA